MKSVIAMVATLSASVTAFAVEETRYNGMKYFGAPQDWISVRLDGCPAEELPAVYADGTMRKVIVRHEVPNIRDIHGPKGFPFLSPTRAGAAFGAGVRVSERLSNSAIPRRGAMRAKPPRVG